MPRLEEPLVVAGVPCNQTTIYDLPVAELVPTTIQSSTDTKDTLKKPLLSNPDMNRKNHTLETRPYRGDDDKSCCDSCCDGLCSDETLCMCLFCCCMCDN